MIAVDVEQGSAEWLAARCGIPTGSDFKKIVTSKGEPSKSATEYAYLLAAEKVSGCKAESFKNAAMARGNELEPEAIAFYEITHGVETKKVGFVLHDSRLFGSSPDRLIGDDGGLEIKCPSAHTHVEYLLNNKLPTEYVQQVQGNMFITGRKWWDFMSYFPGLKAFEIRVQRDEVFIAKLQAALITFCKELDEVVEKIK